MKRTCYQMENKNLCRLDFEAQHVLLVPPQLHQANYLKLNWLSAKTVPRFEVNIESPFFGGGGLSIESPFCSLKNLSLSVIIQFDCEANMP